MGNWHRKAENAGGTSSSYSPFTTALSQTCICGERERKPLSRRWHNCLNCGTRAQRDLFSAYLGLFVYRDTNGTDLLGLEGARASWPIFAPHLQEAGGAPGPSSNKHRGRGRLSQRSAARVVSRRKRKLERRSPTEVLGHKQPDRAASTQEVAA